MVTEFFPCAAGTFGGSGPGDTTEQISLSNLLLPARKLDRSSVRVSGLAICVSAAYLVTSVLIGRHARLITRRFLFRPTKSDSSIECSTCKKVYSSKDDYWDLTVAVGSTEYSESMPAATELFR
jgi:hypothetical protein